jgi:hypothetical protein
MAVTIDGSARVRFVMLSIFLKIGSTLQRFIFGYPDELFCRLFHFTLAYSVRSTTLLF